MILIKSKKWAVERRGEMTKVIAQKKYYTGMNDLVFKNAACTEKDKDILK